jgi:DNA polymerase III epsilon subunit-like protein
MNYCEENMYLFFDTETTGLPKDWKAPLSKLDNWPRMVQLAYMLYDKEGNKLQEADLIIKPEGYTIPKEAADVHGITTDIANQKGIPLELALASFYEAAQTAEVLVAHNMAFDEMIVGAELLRKNKHNIIPRKKRICTMQSGVNLCRIPSKYGFKWPKLTELHYKLFDTDFEDAHNAYVDISITAKCFWKMKALGIID